MKVLAGVIAGAIGGAATTVFVFREALAREVGRRMGEFVMDANDKTVVHISGPKARRVKGLSYDSLYRSSTYGKDAR